MHPITCISLIFPQKILLLLFIHAFVKREQNKMALINSLSWPRVLAALWSAVLFEMCACKQTLCKRTVVLSSTPLLSWFQSVQYPQMGNISKQLGIMLSCPHLTLSAFEDTSHLPYIRQWICCKWHFWVR